MTEAPVTSAMLIAAGFAAVLHDWLSADELAEIRRRNATAEYSHGSCATHDFCDANMAMSPAFEAVTGHTPDASSDVDTDLWNEAWNIARARYLLPRKGPELCGLVVPCCQGNHDQEACTKECACYA